MLTQLLTDYGLLLFLLTGIMMLIWEGNFRDAFAQGVLEKKALVRGLRWNTVLGCIHTLLYMAYGLAVFNGPPGRLVLFLALMFAVSGCATFVYWITAFAIRDQLRLE